MAPQVEDHQMLSEAILVSLTRMPVGRRIGEALDRPDVLV
jgi:hypothetical protein